MSVTIFQGNRRIAAGTRAEAVETLRRLEAPPSGDGFRVFDDRTGQAIDLDLTDAGADSAAASPPRARPPRRGRPKLGVVSKEVTLLPRHWAWLSTQRGGASATLRRLVDMARKEAEGSDRVRAARDAAYHFLNEMAGGRPGYESALRALYAGDAAGFAAAMSAWPADVAAHAAALAADGLGAEGVG